MNSEYGHAPNEGACRMLCTPAVRYGMVAMLCYTAQQEVRLWKPDFWTN